MFSTTRVLSPLVLNIFSLNLALGCLLMAISNRCSTSVRCSNIATAGYVYATDGKNCAAFRNNCEYRNFNCQQMRTYRKGSLRLVTRQTCLANCPDICSLDWNPYCVMVDGYSETMVNPCFWKQQMCFTGEAYVLQYKGECTY